MKVSRIPALSSNINLYFAQEQTFIFDVSCMVTFPLPSLNALFMSTTEFYICIFFSWSANFRDRVFITNKRIGHILYTCCRFIIYYTFVHLWKMIAMTLIDKQLIFPDQSFSRCFLNNCTSFFCECKLQTSSTLNQVTNWLAEGLQTIIPFLL